MDDRQEEHLLKREYLRKDVRAKPIFLSAAALVVFIALVLAGTYLLTRFVAQKDRSGSIVRPMTDPQVHFYGVPVQVKPALDMKQMRESEDQILTSYGWIDQEKGRVRIPVEQAMKVLPARIKGAGR